MCVCMCVCVCLCTNLRGAADLQENGVFAQQNLLEDCSARGELLRLRLPGSHLKVRLGTLPLILTPLTTLILALTLTITRKVRNIWRQRRCVCVGGAKVTPHHAVYHTPRNFISHNTARHSNTAQHSPYHDTTQPIPYHHTTLYYTTQHIPYRHTTQKRRRDVGERRTK